MSLSKTHYSPFSANMFRLLLVYSEEMMAPCLHDCKMLTGTLDFVKHLSVEVMLLSSMPSIVDPKRTEILLNHRIRTPDI